MRPAARRLADDAALCRRIGIFLFEFENNIARSQILRGKLVGKTRLAGLAVKPHEIGNYDRRGLCHAADDLIKSIEEEHEPHYEHRKRHAEHDGSHRMRGTYFAQIAL